MRSVFLSYNHKDKSFVQKLAERLSEEGLAVWLDEAKLKIGDSIVNKISKTISEVDYICVIISRNSIKSRWVNKEISLSIARNIECEKPIILPILKSDCEIPAELKDLLYADFREKENFNSQFNKLLLAMSVEENSDASENGLVVDWRDGGPIINGHGVSINQLESNALLSAFINNLPIFLQKEEERRQSDNVLDSATFLAVIRSCIDVFHYIPTEKEMKDGKLEVVRKFDLFFHFITETQHDLFDVSSNK